MLFGSYIYTGSNSRIGMRSERKAIQVRLYDVQTITLYLLLVQFLSTLPI